MRQLAWVVLLAIGLAACSDSPPAMEDSPTEDRATAMELVFETCSAAHEVRQIQRLAVRGTDVAKLADDGDTILISAGGPSLTDGIRFFQCIHVETAAPPSVGRKTDFSKIERRFVTYDGIDLSWSINPSTGHLEAAFTKR